MPWDHVLFDENEEIARQPSQKEPSSGLVVLKSILFPQGKADTTEQRRVEVWLSRPLTPRQYDMDLLAALIQIFLHNVSPAFKSFQGFQASSHTLPAQLLAMAAVGALFTNCVGSEAMARLYFTDSQRMANHYLLDFDTSCIHGSTSRLQTFLCIGLFGLCSSHKRSSEISESYCLIAAQWTERHCSLLEAVRGHESCTAARNILDDLVVFEGYRVTLLQAQPIFLSYNLRSIRDLLWMLESSAEPALLDLSNSVYLQIGCICTLSWFAINNSRSGQFNEEQALMNAKIEWYAQRLFEMRQEEFSQDPSARMLLFTSLLAVTAPLKYFDRISYWILKYDSTMGQDLPQFGHLRQWQQGGNMDLALNRVDEILSCAELIRSKSPHSSEAPHELYGVFFATLVSIMSYLFSEQVFDQRSASLARIHQGTQYLASCRTESARSMRARLVMLKAKADDW